MPDKLYLFTAIRKVLTGISRKKDCEIVAEWIQSCLNHLHWSVTSTHEGNYDVIAAKFSVFLGHIINKHNNLPNPLFNKCAHKDLGEKKWLEEGDFYNCIFLTNWMVLQ